MPTVCAMHVAAPVIPLLMQIVRSTVQTPRCTVLEETREGIMDIELSFCNLAET